MLTPLKARSNLRKKKRRWKLLLELNSSYWRYGFWFAPSTIQLSRPCAATLRDPSFLGSLTARIDGYLIKCFGPRMGRELNVWSARLGI